MKIICITMYSCLFWVLWSECVTFREDTVNIKLLFRVDIHESIVILYVILRNLMEYQLNINGTSTDGLQHLVELDRIKIFIP